MLYSIKPIQTFYTLGDCLFALELVRASKLTPRTRPTLWLILIPIKNTYFPYFYLSARPILLSMFFFLLISVSQFANTLSLMQFCGVILSPVIGILLDKVHASKLRSSGFKDASSKERRHKFSRLCRIFHHFFTSKR